MPDLLIITCFLCMCVGRVGELQSACMSAFITRLALIASESGVVILVGRYFSQGVIGANRCMGLL